MDAVKILGSLLDNNALGSELGGSILDNLLKGKGSGKAGDILDILLGGKKRASGGGLGALVAVLAAAAGKRGGKTGKGGGSLEILGSLISEAASSGKLGGLGDLFGGSAPPAKKTPVKKSTTKKSTTKKATAKKTAAGKKSSGGLEDLVGAFLGGDEKGSGSTGIGDLLGSLLGGSGGSALSSMLGAASPQAGGGNLLGMLPGREEAVTPPKDAQEEAEILIEAMCNAAKCDGHVDEAEREKVLGKLGNLDGDEIAYLKKHLSTPLKTDSFLQRVPADMAEQVYAFSLMAIKLDSRKEAEYFARLAQGLGLDGEAANEIHARLGQPEIFA